MKKASLVVALIGAALILLSVAFTVRFLADTASVGIIGGADAPTFSFIFFHKGGGACFYLMLSGVAMLLIAVILKIFVKR